MDPESRREDGVATCRTTGLPTRSQRRLPHPVRRRPFHPPHKSCREVGRSVPTPQASEEPSSNSEGGCLGCLVLHPQEDVPSRRRTCSTPTVAPRCCTTKPASLQRPTVREQPVSADAVKERGQGGAPRQRGGLHPCVAHLHTLLRLVVVQSSLQQLLWHSCDGLKPHSARSWRTKLGRRAFPHPPPLRLE